MVGDLANDKGQLSEKKDIKEASGGRLTVINSSLPDIKHGDSFRIERDIVLGRSGSSDIVIKDTYTSSQHARVYVIKEQYWLEDLGSTNGTFLNEVQVKQPIILADGDRLRVGGVTFQFVRCGHEVGMHN